MNRSVLPLVLVVLISLIGLWVPPAVTIGGEIDKADTAWMLTATALVLLMTLHLSASDERPGLDRSQHGEAVPEPGYLLAAK